MLILTLPRRRQCREASWLRCLDLHELRDLGGGHPVLVPYACPSSLARTPQCHSGYQMNFGVASPWSDNDIVKVFQYNKKQRMRSSVLNDLSLLKAREVSNVTICLALNDDDNAKS